MCKEVLLETTKGKQKLKQNRSVADYCIINVEHFGHRSLENGNAISFYSICIFLSNKEKKKHEIQRILSADCCLLMSYSYEIKSILRFKYTNRNTKFLHQ